MITKEAATALLLESFRAFKRNCKSHRLIGPRGCYFSKNAKGWCLLPATMTVVRRAWPRPRGAKLNAVWLVSEVQ